MLEGELRDIPAGSYRSRSVEKHVLEKELRDIAAGSSTVQGCGKTFARERERELWNIAAGNCKSRKVEKM